MSFKDIKLSDYLISLGIILGLVIIPVIGISYLNTNNLFGFIANLSNLQILILSFLQIFIPILGGFFYLLFRYKSLFKDRFNIFKSHFNFRIILIGFFILLIISYLYEKIIKYFGLHFQSNYFDQIGNSNNISLVSFFLFFGVIAAIYEELLFRGLLFDFFKKIFGKIKLINKSNKLIVFLTILITSILFGLIHMQYGPLTILNVVILGFILGIIRYKYGLINSIGVHILNNFIIIFVNMFFPVLVTYLSNHNYLPDKLLSLIQEHKQETNFLINYWSKEAIYQGSNSNKYITKYFLFQNSDLFKCNFPDNLTKEEKKECLRKINNLENKFEGYLNLYKFGILYNLDDLRQIKETINYIKNLKKGYIYSLK